MRRERAAQGRSYRACLPRGALFRGTGQHPLPVRLVQAAEDARLAIAIHRNEQRTGIAALTLAPATFCWRAKWSMQPLWVTSTRLCPGRLCASASLANWLSQLSSQSSLATAWPRMKCAVCRVRSFGLLSISALFRPSWCSPWPTCPAAWLPATVMPAGRPGTGRGAVAALGVADHHDHRTVGPVLQQAAVTQLSFVAKVHDVRPRRQPGAQRRHDHAQAKGGTEGFAGQASLAPGVDGRVPQGVAR